MDVRAATRAVLERMTEILSRGWTQGALARDADGRIARPNSPHAVRWCVYGAELTAIAETSHAWTWNFHVEVLQELERTLSGRTRFLRPACRDHVHFNDSPQTVLADVLRVVELAARWV